MLKTGQMYFKNLVVFTKKIFKSIFGHFSISHINMVKWFCGEKTRSYVSDINLLNDDVTFNEIVQHCSTLFLKELKFQNRPRIL